MSDFLALLPENGWPRLLFDAMWQSTLVAGVGIFTARFLVRQAAARAWVLLLALTACAVVPVASMAARSAGWTLFSAEVTPAPAATTFDNPLPRIASPPRESITPPVAEVSALPSPQPVATPAVVALDPINWLALIGIVWLSATAQLLARLALSLVAVRGIVRRARTCVDSELLEAAEGAARRLGLRWMPRLLVSEQVSTPMVLALVRPAVLLPAADGATNDAANWPAVFRHELAHIVRRDGWTRLWTQLVTAVLPLSPLVWLARRAFQEACEEACDDCAVAAGSDPVDLAATLTAWMQRSSLRPAGVVIGMSATKARTLRLLALRTTPLAGIKWGWRWLTVAAAVGLVVAIAAAQTSATPGQVVRGMTQAEAGKNNAQQVQIDNPLRELAPKLPAPTIKIAGVCEDEKSIPIAGARVRLFAVDFSAQTNKQLLEVETNHKGEYSFSLTGIQEASDRRFMLSVVAQSAGRATASNYLQQEGGGVMDFTLSPAGKLSGRVTAADGKPVQGAIVTVLGLVDPVPGIRAAATDADGRYEITDLNQFDMSNQGGLAFGRIHHPEYARGLLKFKKVPGTADGTLQRPAVVEGVVLNSAGKPTAGAHLTFSNDEIPEDGWTRTTSDERGRFWLATLPPSTYRMYVKLDGHPNLFRGDVELKVGSNWNEIRMEKGGVIRGRVIDVATEKPIELGVGDRIQITEVSPPQPGRRGRSTYAGMNSTEVQRDGTFSLRLPAGQRYFLPSAGPSWQAVNTDQLLRSGIEIDDGETKELEIRVRRMVGGRPLPLPQSLPQQRVTQASEREAAAAISRLGGWVAEATVDGEDHVVEVNMVFHLDARMGRQENTNMSAEALSHVRKFTKLKRLALKGTQATDAALANIRGMERLEQINIWDGSAVTDAGATHLATLPNVIRLHISNSQITDEALRHFSRMERIEYLSLQGNHFTNKCLEYVKDKTQLKGLSLGLGKCEITDDGLKHLAKLTNLERLDLQRSKVTDDGLVHLEGLKKLRTLWISNTAVTPAAYEELQNTLTNLQDGGEK